MSCLISVGRSGKYCCIEAPHTKGELQHIDLNDGALIFKTANLPETVLLCQVDNEWVDSGITVGGESPCTVVCKPGCYKLDIDCAAYNGLDAPTANPVELCYEHDREFDKTAHFMQELAESDKEQDAAILACLAELKLLTAANNDAMALSEILESLTAVCDKLLAQSEQYDDMLTSLQDLCTKIEKGNEEQLDCLIALKERPLPLIHLDNVCY